jgi:hypothetical protein
MIEYTEPPDRIAGIRRRQPNQTRLFDTQEMQPVDDDVSSPRSVSDVGGGGPAAGRDGGGY